MRNRRRYYRIEYPWMERPRFVYESSISPVLECSERGVRFLTAGEAPALGRRIEGRIGMRHGAEFQVAGSVVWSDRHNVALHLDETPIPFVAILREQLYLRRLDAS